MLDIPLQPVWEIHADLPGFLGGELRSSIISECHCWSAGLPVDFLIGRSTLHMRRQGNGIAGARIKEERIFLHRNECGTEHDDRFGVISV